MRVLLKSILWAACAFPATQASASETITYAYDSLGRLVATIRNGGPNAGVSTGTSYDPGGNRSSYTVTGSTASLNLRLGDSVRIAELRSSSRSVGISN